MRKPTNKALIKKLMGDNIEESFVISAIEYYCHAVLADTTDWANSLINKDLWQVIAKANLETIKEHYK